MFDIIFPWELTTAAAVSSKRKDEYTDQTQEIFLTTGGFDSKDNKILKIRWKRREAMIV